MIMTEREIRARKRKNLWIILLLCLPLLLGTILIAGSLVEMLGVRVTDVDQVDALDMEPKEVYYFEDMTLIDYFGYVSSATGTTARDFLVSFTDGEGESYYTCIRLEYTDDLYAEWTAYCDEGVGDGSVSGCFHYYAGGMGATTNYYFDEACEKLGGGESLAEMFFYDGKDPADYRSNACEGDIIMLVMGAIFAVPSLIGIIVLAKKRKQIGVHKTQPAEQADVVVRKFYRRLEALRTWHVVAWLIFLVSMAVLVLIVNEVLPVYLIPIFAMSWLCPLCYYCVAIPLGFSKKLLDREGISEEMLISDLAHGDFIEERFRCGYRTMLLKDQFLPLGCVLWVYIHQQFYMGIPTARYIILQTVDGKKCSISVNADEVEYFKAMLGRNRQKFRPDLLIGYTADTRRRYKELRRAYKNQ